MAHDLPIDPADRRSSWLTRRLWILTPNGRGTDEWFFAVTGRVLTNCGSQTRTDLARGRRRGSAALSLVIPIGRPTAVTIAFTSHVTGNPDIFVMRCEPGVTACGEPRRLTRPRLRTRIRPGRRTDDGFIFRLPEAENLRSGEHRRTDRPEPERITWNGGYIARESRDGRWLYFSKLARVLRFVADRIAGARPRANGNTDSDEAAVQAAATWALGTHELFYYPWTEDPAVPFPSVRAVDVQTGRTRDLPLENIRLGRGLSLSPDERWLLRSQNDRALTLVMIAE